MAPPTEDSAPGSTGPPDRQTLRLLERQLISDSLVAETAFDPDPYLFIFNLDGSFKELL